MSFLTLQSHPMHTPLVRGASRLAVLFLAFFCAFANTALAQQAILRGQVLDSQSGAPIELATLYVEGTHTIAETDAEGRFRLDVPADRDFVLVVRRVGYAERKIRLSALKPGAGRALRIVLHPTSDDNPEIVVRGRRRLHDDMIREDVEELKLLPTTTGNLESALPHIALGTSSGTGGELSSQYNVRGGNYDENLVYVNGFEVYRPQLIRSGQQEGLTFPNLDLIQSLSFSSGGFEARYGDKMSSVLDITYKRPTVFRASVSGSLLGGSAHLEGSKPLGNSWRHFRYLIGARYKTTRYLLGSLDVTGEYTPDFADIQGWFTWDLNADWQLGLLLNYNRSVYRFVPRTRSTAFGLINFALQLYTEFEGQELDDFTTNMAGLSLTWVPDRTHNPLFMKWTASGWKSDENERFDIIGRYSLRQIESGLGSDNFGEVVAELGTGIQHQYVRNFLDYQVVNFAHNGGIELQGKKSSQGNSRTHFLRWGAKFQLEHIEDRLLEWERLDSAGYSLPYDTSAVRLWSVLRTDVPNVLDTRRLTAYTQDTWTWRRDSTGELRLTLGLRGGLWANAAYRHAYLTPRAQLQYKPLHSASDLSFRLAAGMYFQPPFYRELRRPDGTLNTALTAQKSAHVVGGFTWDFYWKKVGEEPFRLIVEAYYKHLWDLVSYEVDNVRIRYSGQTDATGYVAGLDVRINGQFVPGAESWVNLSLLRARERLDGVQHLTREIGKEEGQPVRDVPRPTDRFLNLSIFFQDYLPKNENFKMHLNLSFGTGLPYGIPNNNRIYRNPYRYSPYHRVDIGFSVALFSPEALEKRPNHPLRFTRSSWLSLEIYNLLDVQNTANNTWIKTVFNQQYAVPNYLTSRRVNLRFRMEF